MLFLYQLTVINTATTQAPGLPLGLEALADVSNLHVKSTFNPLFTFI